MAAAEQAAADEFVLAENMYADGVEALEQNDFVEASDFLAQCLQFNAERSGDTSVDAAMVALKYAAALLGCARMKGNSILSGLGKKDKSKDPNGASTSSGTAEAVAEEAVEDETGGDEDLDLAWEVAETARIGMTNNLDSARVTKDHLTELYQLLGDVCAERELFPEALIDYEQALTTVKELEELDPRWEAEIQFKLSNTMEIMDKGPEAQEHIQAATKIMSKLIKEKKAELAEMQKAATAAQKAQEPTDEVAAAADAAAAVVEPAAAPETEAKPADEAAAPSEAAPEVPAAAQPAATKEEGAVTAASTAAAVAAGNDEEKPDAEEEVDEKTELEDEIKELQGVLEELQERSKDLVAQKQQEAAIKEQLRATLGLGAAQPSGAGTSQGAGGSAGGAPGISFGGSTLENGAKPAEGAPKTDAAAQEGVQDLGIITSKRKRDAKVADIAPEAKASKPAASQSEVENVDVGATGDNPA